MDTLVPGILRGLAMFLAEAVLAMGPSKPRGMVIKVKRLGTPHASFDISSPLPFISSVGLSLLFASSHFFPSSCRHTLVV